MRALQRAPAELIAIGRVFGPFAALRIWPILRFPFVSKGTPISIRLPEHEAPLHLRARTSDIPTFFQIFVERQYGVDDFPQSEALDRRYAMLLARGVTPLIIDCGANNGLSAIWLAKRFPAADVYAVEPSPGNFRILCRNAAAYPKIHPLWGGVWDEETSLLITDPSVEPWSFQVEEAAPDAGGPAATGHGADGPPDDDSTDAVPSYTIDAILRMAGAESVFIAKIDIEGAEHYLFRSRTDWVGHTDLLIVELHDWMMPFEGTSRNLFRCIADLPFDFLSRHENVFLFRWPSAWPAETGDETANASLSGT